MTKNAPPGETALIHTCSNVGSGWRVLLGFVSVVILSITAGCSPLRGSGESTNRNAPTSSAEEASAWDAVTALRASYTPENARKAVRILEQKLTTWDSVPFRVLSPVLTVIGDRKVVEAQPQLKRLLYVDPSLPSAGSVIDAAAITLAKVAGNDALEDLLAIATKGPEEALSGVAVALGIVHDARSIQALEQLAQHIDESTRDRALSALAEYCSATSRPLAIHALSDPVDRVRSSASWWMATCGASEDAPYLNSLLRDSDELIRSHALKGLTRLGSKIACDSPPDLLKDQSLAVRESARAYRLICENP